jgi:hypothetical protein
MRFGQKRGRAGVIRFAQRRLLRTFMRLMHSRHIGIALSITASTSGKRNISWPWVGIVRLMA